MYSPATRLFTVLELLQSHKQLSGSEIARRLEVNTRTVRRYIVMLQDMGIPVEAERGPYGAYQLRRGYKLPPLMYTDAEAVALTLGLIAIREFQFPVDVAAVEGALAKTERVMPEKLLQQVRGLQEAIAFNISLPNSLPQFQVVTALSTAVQQRQQVYLSYTAWNGSETERIFDPYGIVYNDGYWYTAGYCHLRHDLRTFRLDRIAALEPREGMFERPADFDALAYVLNAVASASETERIEVLMKTTLEQAQAVCPEFMGTLETTDEGVIFRRVASQLEWVAYFLLSLDFPLVIRKNDQLREKIRQIGAKARQLVEDEEEL